MKTLRVLLLALALLGAPATGASAVNELPGVGPVSVAGSGAGATLSIPGRAGTPYRVTWLTAPYRLAVDLQGHWLGAPESSIWLGDGLVTRIRASRQGSGITRVVFDLRAPADIRAENRGTSLVLVVLPRGAATAAAHVPVPAPYQAPMAVPYQAPLQSMAIPTPRPVPAYPGYGYSPYGAVPAPRVTPLPVMPPMAWGTPGPQPPAYNPPPVYYQPAAPGYAAPVPPAAPMPAYPSAPPVPMPAPYQPPAAPQVPGPTVPQVALGNPTGNDDPFAEEVVAAPAAFFGNRAYAGPGLVVGLTETYLAGDADLSTGLFSSLDLGLDQMFHPNFGLHLGLRAHGYAFKDSDLGDEVVRKHTRDEQQVCLGLRGRFDLGGGLEVYAQPQGVVRNVMVGTTINNTVTTEGVDKIDEYVAAPHLGFGGGLGFGVGYPLTSFFGLAGVGEVNFLAGGAGKAAPIYPLLQAGGGLEGRFNFSGFGLTLGYKAMALSNGSAAYSQLWHGPVLTLGANY